MLKQRPKSHLLASKQPSKNRRSFLRKSLLAGSVRSGASRLIWKRKRVSRNEVWTQKRSFLSIAFKSSVGRGRFSSGCIFGLAGLTAWAFSLPIALRFSHYVRK